MENVGTRKSVRHDISALTLRDMTSPLFRHRWAVLVTFCLIFAIAIEVAWGWADHYYVATMQVLVSRERSEPAVTGQQNAAVTENSTAVTADDVASETALLQGRDMLQEIARVCKLTKHDPSFFDSWKKPNSQNPELIDAKDVERSTNMLAANLRVEPEKMSRVIDVKYGSSGAPETPACVLQTLGKLYLAKHLQLQRPAGTFDFFAEETEKYRQALADSESRLAEFTKSEGVAAPEILRTYTAQTLVAAQASLHQTRQEIAADQQRLENLKRQMEGTPPRSSTAEVSISASTLLEQLHSALLASQVKRLELLMKYDQSYPLVKEVEAEIEQTKEAIAEAEAAKYVNTTTDRDPTFDYLRQDQAKTEADLASGQATEGELQKTIRSMQLEMMNLDVKALGQGALLREAKANEASYLLYLTKREQERTSDALDAKRIANVAIAVPESVPALTAYSPFSIMLQGFFLALLGGIVAGYLAELADPSFRTPAEVEGTLNITVLAAVPRQVA